jgi:hypothetical protein
MRNYLENGEIKAKNRLASTDSKASGNSESRRFDQEDKWAASQCCFNHELNQERSMLRELTACEMERRGAIITDTMNMKENKNKKSNMYENPMHGSKRIANELLYNVADRQEEIVLLDDFDMFIIIDRTNPIKPTLNIPKKYPKYL